MSEKPQAALASAVPAEVALLRLSGEGAFAVAERAGLDLPRPWRVAEGDWPLDGGSCPVRVFVAPAGRSFTGLDLIEIQLPGAPDLVAIALQALYAAGAEAAGPGAFSRMALAHGRLDLDGALALLALSRSSDEAARQQALGRLHGALHDELEPLRVHLLEARARVEAGLDFVEEADVQAWDPAWLRELLSGLAAVLGRWRRAAVDLGVEPLVCLVGPTNAGKSALFRALTGHEALVSAEPGTTRDWLQASWTIAGRRLRLMDSAGWLEQASGSDAEAIAQGRARLGEAALVLLCSAPDAPAPADPEPLRALPAERVLRLATKIDLAPDHAVHGELGVSGLSGVGLAALAEAVALRCAALSDGDPWQQGVFASAQDLVDRLLAALPPDEVLAQDLRELGDLLAALIGETTDDEILAEIFGRFCIGK